MSEEQKVTPEEQVENTQPENEQPQADNKQAEVETEETAEASTEQDIVAELDKKLKLAEQKNQRAAGLCYPC
jgi:hypothetical protein